MAEQESSFEKKLSEQTAETAFGLTWRLIQTLGNKAWEMARVRGAMELYAENYLHRHGLVRVLGMTKPIPLHKLYTSVRVVDPYYLHSFASPETMERSFRESGRKHRMFHQETARDGIEVANETRLLNVLGAPGSGKSTFLRRLGQEAMLARNANDKVARDKRLKGKYTHPHLPVLIELRQFRGDSEKIDLISTIAKEFSICGFPNSTDFVEKALEEGLLLVIFDGLDEVPDARLDETIKKVRELVDLYGKKCRFVTSCRSAQYKNYFTSFTDVMLADFSDKQVEEFSKNWFTTTKDIRANTAQNFLDTINSDQNQSARELARTPLLLTFLCLTFDRDLSLPPTRATLYKRALDILLREWSAENRVHNEPIYHELHADLEIDMLSEIASKLFLDNRFFFTRDEVLSGIRDFMERQLKKSRTLDADQILSAIERQQGLIVRRASDSYSFSHLTIQEYLTAREFSRTKQWIQHLHDHFSSDKWREVWLILAGVENADSQISEMARELQRRCCNHVLFKQVINWMEESIDQDALAAISEESALALRLTFFSLAFSLAVADELKFVPLTFLQLASDLDIEIGAFIEIYSKEYGASRLGTALIQYFMDAGILVPSYTRRFRKAFEILSTGGNQAIAQVRSVLLLPNWRDFDLHSILRDARELIDCVQLIFNCRDSAYRLSRASWNEACSFILIAHPSQDV